MRLLAFVTGLALLAPTLNVADAAVIVVDAAGGGDHTSINAAIVAAANGDIVHVKSGDYRLIDLFGVLVDGKSIVLVGAQTPAPLITGIEVKNVPAGSTQIVRNFSMVPSPFVATLGGLKCSQNSGAVLVENCSVVGPDGSVGFAGIVVDASPAVLVSNSAFVAITRCSISAGKGVDAVGGINQHGSSGGGDGLFVSQSNLTAFDSVVNGGAGGDGPPASSASNRGGHGCLLVSGSARWHGVSVRGGMGGNALSSDLASCGAGGDGLVVPAGASAESFASSFIGGDGGWTTVGTQAAFGTDENLWGPASHVVIAYTTKRTFRISTPTTELLPVFVFADGVPNDLVYVLLAFKAGHFVAGGTIGWLATAPPYFGPFVFGSVPASGTLAFSAAAPMLSSPSVEGEAFVFEPIFVNSTEAVVGPPSCFVLLKP
ncbi:MAG: hypothetical protein IPH13_15440 [Planctomycetes bacterium]|nr:hypothetical protein [Planctomycetota bacterium]MCC7168969.1 hypothetical protein [Planctomycetota bacterium]